MQAAQQRNSQIRRSSTEVLKQMHDLAVFCAKSDLDRLGVGLQRMQADIDLQQQALAVEIQRQLTALGQEIARTAGLLTTQASPTAANPTG